MTIQPEPEKRHRRYCGGILKAQKEFFQANPMGPDLIDVQADAAEAVADEEIAEALSISDTATVAMLEERRAENTRLRAELKENEGVMRALRRQRDTAEKETARLRTELKQARELLDDRRETQQDHARGEHGYCGAECEVTMPSEMLSNFILAKGYPGTAGALDELLRRAGQARGTTGQDTVPADREQETRQQIRLACASAERVPVIVLEPHDYQEHANAVLPVVRAALAAAVRRALEDTADELDDDARRLDHAVKSPALNGAAYLLRCKAAGASPARKGQPASVSPTAALLATSCDTCRHTLNWHTNYAGCTVPLCVCGRFQTPAATEERQA